MNLFIKQVNTIIINAPKMQIVIITHEESHLNPESGLTVDVTGLTVVEECGLVVVLI